MGEFPIRLLICDDHRVLADALAALIDHDPRFELVGPPISDPEEIASIVEHSAPDVVLLDVVFERSDLSGIAVAHQLADRSPRVRVLLLTSRDDDELLVQASESGAAGVLHKSQPLEAILPAIIRAAAGEDLYVADRLLQAVRNRAATPDAPITRLSPRELEVLDLLTSGATNAEIALSLTISPRTAEGHVLSIMDKFGVRSRTEAVAVALQDSAAPSKRLVLPHHETQTRRGS